MSLRAPFSVVLGTIGRRFARRAIKQACYVAILCSVTIPTSEARTLPEYTAIEAKKHIGEKATVVGKVDCIDHGRRHTGVLIGGCDLKKVSLCVVVPDDTSGPELDCGQLRGVTIAVTGKIESSGGTPQIAIKSTTQIVPRTPINPNYLLSAMEKKSRGDLDGAIADLDRVVELTHEPSMYIQRAEAKVDKGDLDGAISDYDQLIEHYPNEGVYYLKRERLKMKKSDYAGVIADSSRAIELLARYYTLHPNDRSTFILAQAYSERGEAKEAMGDPAGAIADYENAIRNDFNAPIYKNKLKHAQAEGERKQPVARSSPDQKSGSEPKSAEVVDIPAAQAQFGIKAGNIKVTFADGHAETITQNGNCMQPHVSAKGDVGWIQCTGFDRKGYALNEKVIIRSAKGDQNEFGPNPKAPFIGAWTFVDDDSGVVIQSMSFHGPSSYIRYDLSTGKVTNKKDGRDDSEPLPKWAQPLAD